MTSISSIYKPFEYQKAQFLQFGLGLYGPSIVYEILEQASCYSEQLVKTIAKKLNITDMTIVFQLERMIKSDFNEDLPTIQASVSEATSDINAVWWCSRNSSIVILTKDGKKIGFRAMEVKTKQKEFFTNLGIAIESQ